jgi:hypothetical protein
VEDKDHLNDIDGYFVCDLRALASGELQRQLNLLDPYKASFGRVVDRRVGIRQPSANTPR